MRGDNAMGNTMHQLFRVSFWWLITPPRKITRRACALFPPPRKNILIGSQGKSFPFGLNVRVRHMELFAAQIACSHVVSLARPAQHVDNEFMRSACAPSPALLAANYGIGKLNFDCSITITYMRGERAT